MKYVFISSALLSGESEKVKYFLKSGKFWKISFGVSQKKAVFEIAAPVIMELNGLIGLIFVSNYKYSRVLHRCVLPLPYMPFAPSLNPSLLGDGQPSSPATTPLFFQYMRLHRSPDIFMNLFYTCNANFFL